METDNRKAHQLTKEQIEQEVKRLGPFLHRIELSHGCSTYDPKTSKRGVEFTRVQNLVDHAFPDLLKMVGGSLKGKRVLDIACNCGGFSLEAARLGAEEVLGIDIAEKYIDQANFIKKATGAKNVDFRLVDVNELSPEAFGIFDVTFCFGILYHFENPVLSMKTISEVTGSTMMVDTNIKRIPLLDSSLNEPYWWMNFPAIATDNSLDMTTSQWRKHGPVVQFTPNEKAVADLLRFLGFTKISRLPASGNNLETRYKKGRRAVFLAQR